MINMAMGSILAGQGYYIAGYSRVVRKQKNIKNLHVLLVPCASDNCLLIFIFPRSWNSFGLLVYLTIDGIEDIQRSSSHLIGNAHHCLQMFRGVGHERHGMNEKDAESSIDLGV